MNLKTVKNYIAIFINPNPESLTKKKPLKSYLTMENCRKPNDDYIINEIK